MEKVGLLGGTFDPVHDGHIQLALAAKEELQLDRVLVTPAPEPPHKRREQLTSFAHRKQMLITALSGVEGVEPCFVEGDLPTPSYTIDTIRLLQSRDYGQIEYFFIIGVDAFADLLSWKSHAELLQRVKLIVAQRKGFTGTEKLAQLAQFLGYTPKSALWTGGPGWQDIYFLQTSPIEISSSQIRNLLESGCNEVAGVNGEVLDYIQHHHLYLKG